MSIQDCLIGIEKRAERVDDDKLTETFVDAAPLLASVSNQDHQVIFGRRGTGKTHLLKYLHDHARSRGETSIYLDLRSVGSNGSIYNDREKTHSQRATPLLLDVLGVLHENLVQLAVERGEKHDLSKSGPLLDSLADAISTVEVVGTVEQSTETSSSDGKQVGAEASISADAKGPTASLKLSGGSQNSNSGKSAFKRTGTESYYIKFGTVQSTLRNVLEALGNHRVWLLLDEWSEIPIDIQPYLADLLRRCILPLSKMTLKVAAIEQRSNFIIRRPGEYLGIELGADVGGDVNLDDFMVFDNDADQSLSFFAALLFKHYRATDGLLPGDGALSADEFIRATFTQITAFEEFVRAVEGVPRDAVYLASLVARRAYGRLISVQDVRASARDWYSRDKSSILRADPALGSLLHWVIEEVIAHRRARAFLLESSQRHPLIETLFDSRLLHVLKKNISSNEQPGMRYDVYKLDYGCYVDLISSSKAAPLGLLPIDESDAQFLDVPPDDYRSIRRAILDLKAFQLAQESLSKEPGLDQDSTPS